MSLWALRVAVLGTGPWQLVRSEEELVRLMNAPRRRRRMTSRSIMSDDSLF